MSRAAFRSIATLLVLAIAGSANLAQAATPRIFGGSTVTDPAQAPWSVLINASDASKTGACTGSIIDATHVITAAHCVFVDETTTTQWPLGGYLLAAGIVAVGAGADLSHEQQRAVSAVRVHPGYARGKPGVDVAVLSLSAPLSFAGPQVQPVAVAGAGDIPAVGSAARLFGWGEVTPGMVDGREHLLDLSLLHQSRCFGGVPSALCTGSPTGAVCAGDSGGGLVTVDARPRLIAVLSAAIGGVCASGTLAAHTDVTTHEIADWLAGSDTPPPAPRGVGAPTMSGQPFVGGTLTCAPATWTVATQTDTWFIDGATYEVLQTGKPAYVPIDRDARRKLACVSVATSPGGTTEWQTGSIEIQPALDPGLSLAIDRLGKVSIRAGAPVTLGLRLAFTNPAGAVVKALDFSSGTPPATVPPLPAGRYRACLSSARNGIYGPGSVCVDWAREGEAAALLKRGTIKKVRGNRFSMLLRAERGLVGKRVTLQWRIARCKACPARVHRQKAILRARTTVTSPSVPRDRTLWLHVRLPTVTVSGVLYQAGTKPYTVGRRR